MAGTDADHNTTPRPISPVSPTEALKLLLDSNPSIHAAAERLTTAMRTNECRLWCNGNLLSPDYIATSLVVVARTEADGRPRADVVSSVREPWVRQVYKFEFDAEEVCARLLPPINKAEARALIDDKSTDRVIAPGQPAAAESPDSTSTKSWLTSELDRMKDAGEIIASPTALANELEKRMKKAARINPAIRPLSQLYIRAQLYELGLVTPRRRR